ncbi:MAG: hypothetical protein MUE73_20140 [Planctomycetes bacterium]|jgi:hypothetical protein|nr:hypothetical protein [Planctomycetota bacterium]
MPRRLPLPLVLFLGWLLPGAGHFVLGRRTQAAVFFVAITATFLGGMALADFTNVNFERHRYYFFAQVFNGAETFAALLLTKDLILTRVPVFFGVQTFDIGMLYTSAAALLNLMVVCSAWAIVLEREKAPAPAPEPEAAA